MSNDSTHAILAAGALAAFTVDLLVYPLDTIKTRYQSQDYQNVFAKTQPSKSTPKPLFRGLYQGIGSVIFATLPAAGAFFLTYESAKSALGSALPSKVPDAFVHALASAGAELASCTILTPAEVIKQNAQMLQQSAGSSFHHHGSRSTSIEAARMIWRGPGGGPMQRLWTGYTVLAARNLPFTAIQFPLFEFTRDYLWKWRDQDRSVPQMEARSSLPADRNQKTDGVPRRQGGRGLTETGLINGASAAMAGALAAFLTTPTDVVKTRMMLAAGDTESADKIGGVQRRKRPNRSSLEVAKTVLSERGIRGLFRGAMLRTTWTAFGSGLYLGSYEVAKVWIKG